MYEMTDKDYIDMLLNKSVDIQNRVNTAVIEILRKHNGKEVSKDLAESMHYVADEIDRLINK
jgi:capsular polysaccharide biosynthesis protein